MPTITQSDNPNNSLTIPPIELDEFLPVVKLILDNNEEEDNIKIEETNEKVTLSKYIDSSKRNFNIQQITTNESNIKLSFMVEDGNKTGSIGSYFEDDDGYIEAELSIDNKQIKIISETKILKKYGDIFDLEIKFKDDLESDFYIEFKANDDEEGYAKGEYENVFCGKIKIKKTKSCLCSRKLTEKDLEDIITKLRKQDGVQHEQEFAPNGLDPIFITGNGTKLVQKGKNVFYTLDNVKYEGTEKPKKYKPKKSNFDKIGTSIFQLNYDEKIDKNEATLKNFAKELNSAFEKYEINTCIRKIHFLAQCYHESQQFQSSFEQDAVTNPSGGKDYIGRGLIQITHDYNYENFYEGLKGNKPNSKELLSFAKKIAKKINLTVNASAYYWRHIGMPSINTNINLTADNDNVLFVSKSVFGNVPEKNINGYSERVKYTKELKKIFEYDKCSRKK